MSLCQQYGVRTVSPQVDILSTHTHTHIPKCWNHTFADVLHISDAESDPLQHSLWNPDKLLFYWWRMRGVSLQVLNSFVFLYIYNTFITDAFFCLEKTRGGFLWHFDDVTSFSPLCKVNRLNWNNYDFDFSQKSWYSWCPTNIIITWICS